MGFRGCRFVVVFVCLCICYVCRAQQDPTAATSTTWSTASPSPDSACSDVTFVTRNQWMAQAPVDSVDLAQPVVFVVVHHTDTPECNSTAACELRVKNIQDYHMDTNGWDDIGYNFLIGGDERVYIGRGWDTVGTHAGSVFYNQHSVGIAIIGNYTSSPPTTAVCNVLKKLIACGVESNHLVDWYVLRGHRDVREIGPTECPGDELYKKIKGWPRYIPDCPASM